MRGGCSRASPSSLKGHTRTRGLRKLSKSTAARMCSELRERFAAFGRRDLCDIHLAALLLDPTLLAVRPDGPKEAS
jgi:transposase-like protein